MVKAETCRLYELVPKLCDPITAILGKAPMVRAGNTGTIPFSMRSARIEGPGALKFMQTDAAFMTPSAISHCLLLAFGMYQCTTREWGSHHVREGCSPMVREEFQMASATQSATLAGK